MLISASPSFRAGRDKRTKCSLFGVIDTPGEPTGFLLEFLGLSRKERHGGAEAKGDGAMVVWASTEARS